MNAAAVSGSPLNPKCDGACGCLLNQGPLPASALRAAPSSVPRAYPLTGIQHLGAELTHDYARASHSVQRRDRPPLRVSACAATNFDGCLVKGHRFLRQTATGQAR